MTWRTHQSQRRAYGNEADRDFPAMWAIIALSAQAALKVKSRDELIAICEATLRGKTPDEPHLDDAVHDIALRGFHVYRGVAWGLLDEHPNGIALVRLGNVPRS